jgi:hypothetical protein
MVKAHMRLDTFAFFLVFLQGSRDSYEEEMDLPNGFIIYGGKAFSIDVLMYTFYSGGCSIYI